MFIAVEGNRVIDVREFFWDYAPTASGPVFCIEYKGERTPHPGMFYDFDTAEVYHDFENVVGKMDPLAKQVLYMLSQLEQEARTLAIDPKQRLLYEQGELAKTNK